MLYHDCENHYPYRPYLNLKSDNVYIDYYVYKRNVKQIWSAEFCIIVSRPSKPLSLPYVFESEKLQERKEKTVLRRIKDKRC